MTTRPRLVLVGAGHAHAVALRRWARRGVPDVDLVVVADRPDTMYSGMVPGWIAGEYRREELVMDARVMTRRAGARLVLGVATEVDARRRRVELADGTSLPYDLASLDVGSVVDVPAGEGPHAPLSARRPDEVAKGLTRLEQLADSGRRPRVVVVGGGAAGVELAACIRGRGVGGVTLLEAGPRLMAEHDPSVADRAGGALASRGVTVRCGSAVERVGPDGLHLEDGDSLATDLTIWATGPSSPPLLAASELPTDGHGFVRIQADLRVEGHDGLFAAGDCASFGPAEIPKAGVHAVRQGEVLYRNLAATASAMQGSATRDRASRKPAEGDGGGSVSLADASLSRYEPQSDYLTLLNLGDGTALGTKWGHAVEGRWVRWLKDVIDRRFVGRFQD